MTLRRRLDAASSTPTSTLAATPPWRSWQSLKPLHPEIADFPITAGNSSGLNDAAAALVLTSDEFADAHGLTAARPVRSWASVGVEPAHEPASPRPPPSRRRLAGRASSVGDVALFEINEAFASMCVATTRILGIDPDIVNVSGSGCSLGHPIAATGAQDADHAHHDLRRRGGGIGVASMCAGGGMGSAVVIEVGA